MQDMVILCSAPADIKFALALREQHPEARCRLFALHVETMATFLRELHLPERTEVVFISSPAQILSATRVWNNVRIRRYIDAVIRQHFAKATGSAVYFFTPYVDWFAFAILSHVRPRNDVVYVPYLADAADECGQLSLRQWLTLRWMRWATRADLVYRRHSTRLVPVWRDMTAVARIALPDVRAVTREYSFRIDQTADGKPSILLFPGMESLAADLRPVTEELLRRLQERGARVFLKPHPREGAPLWLEGTGVVVVPRHIPSEFLDMSGFSGAVGVESAALATTAKLSDIPCVSLLDVVTYRNPSRVAAYRDHVSRLSDGRVVFASTMDSAVSLLLNPPPTHSSP